MVCALHVVVSSSLSVKAFDMKNNPLLGDYFFWGMEKGQPEAALILACVY